MSVERICFDFPTSTLLRFPESHAEMQRSFRFLPKQQVLHSLFHFSTENASQEREIKSRRCNWGRAKLSLQNVRGRWKNLDQKFCRKTQAEVRDWKGFLSTNKTWNYSVPQRNCSQKKIWRKNGFWRWGKELFFLKLLCVNLRALQMACSVFLNPTKGWRHLRQYWICSETNTSHTTILDR